jgi:hypothetical protein
MYFHIEWIDPFISGSMLYVKIVMKRKCAFLCQSLNIIVNRRWPITEVEFCLSEPTAKTIPYQKKQNKKNFNKRIMQRSDGN